MFCMKPHKTTNWFAQFGQIFCTFFKIPLRPLVLATHQIHWFLYSSSSCLLCCCVHLEKESTTNQIERWNRREMPDVQLLFLGLRNLRQTGRQRMYLQWRRWTRWFWAINRILLWTRWWMHVSLAPDQFCSTLGNIGFFGARLKFTIWVPARIGVKTWFICSTNLRPILLCRISRLVSSLMTKNVDIYPV